MAATTFLGLPLPRVVLSVSIREALGWGMSESPCLLVGLTGLTGMFDKGLSWRTGCCLLCTSPAFLEVPERLVVCRSDKTRSAGCFLTALVPCCPRGGGV